MIIILAEPDDAHALVVERKLKQRGADFLWFDYAQFPSQMEISLTYSATGRMQCALRTDEKTVDLNTISALWERFPQRLVPHKQISGKTTRDYVEREATEFLTNAWHTLDCLWVPASPSQVSRAKHKAVQLQLAGELGFKVPPTLISNSRKHFLEFYRRHNGHIISKGFYNGVLKEPLSNENLYSVCTEVVSNRDVGYASTIRYCPIIFQAYVPKRVELRITIIGRQVFAAEIHSQQSNHTRYDWRRYDYSQTPYRPHDLPDEVKRLCLQLMEQLGLCFGAIDMVVTPDGRYVFLEINPNGQWLWIENLTGLPISEAICDLLTSREKAMSSLQANAAV